MIIRPRGALLDPTLRRPSALQSVPRDPGHLWLDKNENHDAELRALAHRVLTALPESVISTYPEAGALYRKLAAWVGVSPDALLLTPGSDGAIRLTFELLIEAGDCVVHTSPTFAMYPVYCQMFGARAVVVDYAPSPSGPVLDVEAMLGVIARVRPKLVCLPNPDSPTGTVVDAPTLRRLLAACEAVGAALLIDEAYHPYHEPSVASWTAASPHLIVARTFAKGWGAAGLRVGFLVAHPETCALLHKLRPMYEVSTMATAFMEGMLDHTVAMEASVARIQAGKALFAAAMEGFGFPVVRCGGNFVHVAFGAQGPAIHQALAPDILYKARFDHPSLAGYSRFSVAPAPIMQRVVDRIASALPHGT